jgi:hypothetical protein
MNLCDTSAGRLDLRQSFVDLLPVWDDLATALLERLLSGHAPQDAAEEIVAHFARALDRLDDAPAFQTACLECRAFMKRLGITDCTLETLRDVLPEVLQSTPGYRWNPEALSAWGSFGSRLSAVPLIG